MTNTLPNTTSNSNRLAEVMVAPTWHCNLNCSYCFIEGNREVDSSTIMSPGMAVRVIDALAEGLGDVRKTIVHLYGGEPFTNLAAIEAMVDRAWEKYEDRFSFAVTTNGTILSDGVLKVLDKGKFQVQLSLDGPEEVHDECRRWGNGSPTHHQVIEFLEAVRKHTCCYVWGSAVIRSGWRLWDATEYLRTLPIHEIKAQAVRLKQGTPFALTPEERKLYYQDLEAIGRRVIEELEAGKIPMDNRFSSRVLQLLIKGNRMHFCDAGNTNFGIVPNGEVMACLLLEDPAAHLGHIDDDPRSWREAGHKWQAAQTLGSGCESCEHLHMCGGGCPSMMAVCGQDECDMVAKNCEVAQMIFDHFKDNQEALLALAGVT